MKTSDSDSSSSPPTSLTSLVDIPDEAIDLIFLDFPRVTLFELSFVSRAWQSTVYYYVMRNQRFLLLISNQSGSISMINRDDLFQEHRMIPNVPVLTRRVFPLLEFPVRLIVGSSSGLVCLLDRRNRPVVLNPGTQRMHFVPVVSGLVPGHTYAFGSLLEGTRRSTVIVRCPCGSMLRRVHIYNLTTLQWTTRSITGVTHASITRWDCSAFVGGHFLWLGRNGNSDSVLLFDGATNIVSSMDLIPSMRGMDLHIGNMGDDFAILWPTDDRRGLFWIVDIQNRLFSPITVNFGNAFDVGVRFFARRDVSLLAAGFEFLPLSFIGASSILFLLRVDDEVFINVFNHSTNVTESLTINSSSPFTRLAPQTNLYLAVSFAACFFSTWDLP